METGCLFIKFGMRHYNALQQPQIYSQMQESQQTLKYHTSFKNVRILEVVLLSYLLLLEEAKLSKSLLFCQHTAVLPSSRASCYQLYRARNGQGPSTCQSQLICPASTRFKYLYVLTVNEGNGSWQQALQANEKKSLA